jgi:hypothetical protein
MHALTAPAADFEALRAPAQVRLQGDDDAVVPPVSAIPGAALKQQRTALHEQLHALWLHAVLAGVRTLAVQQRRDAAVSVARARGHQVANTYYTKDRLR